MATVEVLLSDLMAPTVQLFLPTTTTTSITSLEGDISRVLQRSLSLPITMRSLIRRCQKPDHVVKQASGPTSPATGWQAPPLSVWLHVLTHPLYHVTHFFIATVPLGD